MHLPPKKWTDAFVRYPKLFTFAALLAWTALAYGLIWLVNDFGTLHVPVSAFVVIVLLPIAVRVRGRRGPLVVAALFGVVLYAAFFVRNYGLRNGCEKIGEGEGRVAYYCFSWGFRDGDWDSVMVYPAAYERQFLVVHAGPSVGVERELSSPDARCDGDACEGLFESPPVDAEFEKLGVCLVFENGKTEFRSLPPLHP